MIKDWLINLSLKMIVLTTILLIAVIASLVALILYSNNSMEAVGLADSTPTIQTSSTGEPYTEEEWNQTFLTTSTPTPEGIVFEVSTPEPGVMYYLPQSGGTWPDSLIVWTDLLCSGDVVPNMVDGNLESITITLKMPPKE